MRKYYVVSLVAAGLVVLGGACSKASKTTTNDNENAAAVEVNTSANLNANVSITDNSNTNRATEPEPVVTNSSDNTNVSDTNSSANSNGSLTVSLPEKNSTLDSPFEVAGKSSATKMYARVKNTSGVTLFTETVAVRNGAFDVWLTINVTSSLSGTVEVYELDGAGNEKNLVSVPVTFRATSTTTTSETNTNQTTDSNTNTGSGYNY